MRHIKITTYRGHAIYADRTDDCEMVYMWAKKRNGTDEYHSTYEETIEAIDKYEDNRPDEYH